eukprot:4432703-Amphidinium_carterae.1
MQSIADDDEDSGVPGPKPSQAFIDAEQMKSQVHASYIDFALSIPRLKDIPRHSGQAHGNSDSAKRLQRSFHERT